MCVCVFSSFFVLSLNTYLWLVCKGFLLEIAFHLCGGVGFFLCRVPKFMFIYAFTLLLFHKL